MENADNKNYNSVFTTLGATNHSKEERQKEDYYATEPRAMTLLLNEETFNSQIWECAVGSGELAYELEKAGYKVFGSDIVDRGYPNTSIIDFLKTDGEIGIENFDIITNPPYKNASEFVEKGMSILPLGNKMAFFLKLQFLEGQKRRELFKKYPPKTVYVSSARLTCAKNGDFEKYKSSAIAYAWFVWEKGWYGHPIIKWIN